MRNDVFWTHNYNLLRALDARCTFNVFKLFPCVGKTGPLRELSRIRTKHNLSVCSRIGSQIAGISIFACEKSMHVIMTSSAGCSVDL